MIFPDHVWLGVESLLAGHEIWAPIPNRAHIRAVVYFGVYQSGRVLIATSEGIADFRQDENVMVLGSCWKPLRMQCPDCKGNVKGKKCDRCGSRGYLRAAAQCGFCGEKHSPTGWYDLPVVSRDEDGTETRQCPCGGGIRKMLATRIINKTMREVQHGISERTVFR